jgi:hypothetical protein
VIFRLFRELLVTFRPNYAETKPLVFGRGVQIFMNIPDDGNGSDDPDFSGSEGGLDGWDSDESDAEVDAVRPVSPLTPI